MENIEKNKIWFSLGEKERLIFISYPVDITKDELEKIVKVIESTLQGGVN